MHTVVFETHAISVALDMVPLLALHAVVQIVVSCQGKVLLKVLPSTVKVLGEPFFVDLACLVRCFYFGMLVELKAGTIELEDCHDCGTFHHAVFEVAVLFAVEVGLALGRKVIKHVLGEVLQVDLHVAWVGVHDVVNNESYEFDFSRRYFAFYHLIINI